MKAWRFSKKHLQRLTVLKEEGRTVLEIAAVLGCGKSTVSRWWKLCGRPQKQYRDLSQTLRHRDRVMELCGEGRSLKYVAKRLGVAETTLWKWMRYWGESTARLPHNRRRTAEHRRKQRHASRDVMRRQAEGLGWPEADGPGQARLLEVLARNGPTSKREIAALLGLSYRTNSHRPPTVNYHLTRLVRRGMVVTAKRSNPNLYDLSGWLRGRWQERQEEVSP